MINWYSAEDRNVGKKVESRFGDSKFALDRRASYIREMVQNSIDVKKDNPVVIKINIDKVNREKIPGIDVLLNIIENCKTVANVDAKREYESALRLLNKEYVYCLKISDYNTLGVVSDPDENYDSRWRALLYDTGNSYKKRAGAAGSHGVGKKATFIISEANTVFYSTMFDSEDGSTKSLTEGKFMLSTWFDESGKKMNGDGWYGNIDINRDIENCVCALEKDDLNTIDDYFVRRDKNGTDVIAIAIDFEEKEEQFKINYINEVLENFYVSIIDGNTVVSVFGEEINAKTIDDVFNRYYDIGSNPILAGTNKCLLVGNLKDNKRVYQNIKPEKIDINIKDENVGYILLYFDNNNEKNKKYYSIIRDHGMKIRDYKLSTEKEFTAVVKVCGEKLNTLLLSLENAAHDDFAPKDDTGIKYNEDAKAALKQINRKVGDYILARTKIKSEDSQKIEGMESLLNLPGELSVAKPVKNEVKIVTPKPKTPIKPPTIKDKRLVTDYISKPRIIKVKNGYLAFWNLEKNHTDGIIVISAIDSDGKEDKEAVKRMGIIDLKLDGNQLYLNRKGNGYMYQRLSDKNQHKIEFKVINEMPYRLTVDIYENI